jgi:excisionase family DNA binding protein
MMYEPQEASDARCDVVLEPILVRVEEAARILSLSRSTIYEMMDAGELPSVRRGTARRIPLGALREWVDRQVAGHANG